MIFLLIVFNTIFMNISFAHEAFVDLMSKTENILNCEVREPPKKYKGLNSSSLEPCAVEKIRMACATCMKRGLISVVDLQTKTMSLSGNG